MLRVKRECGKGTTPLKSDRYSQTWDSILPGHEQLLTMSCSIKIASWNRVLQHLGINFNEIMSGISEIAKFTVISGLAMTKSDNMHDLTIVLYYYYYSIIIIFLLVQLC